MVVTISILAVAAFLLVFAVVGIMDVALGVASTANDALRIMRDPTATDEERESHVQKAAIKLFGAFFGILVRVAAALAASVAPILIADFTGIAPAETVFAFLARWDVLLVMTVIITVGWFAMARLRRRDADGYSGGERMLHRLALSGNAIPDVMHDIERAIFLKRAPALPGQGHVFVCGLARAGTTVVTRELHATGVFGSLTYRDMPFVLAPNLWNSLSKSSSLEATQRAHGDGLIVDLDSPEALDEVYWRLKCGEDYIRSDALLPHNLDEEAAAGYGDLMRLVLLKTGQSRYLSKCNNTILRLPSLACAFPGAVFLVPVREPHAHAASLQRQHDLFSDGSRFQQDFMAWLVHHEFGKSHRPFVFGSRPEGDPQDTGYWLQLWLQTYRALDAIEAEHPNVIFVAYETLCNDTDYQNALMQHLGFPEAQFSELRPQTADLLSGGDDTVLAEARTLYRKLTKRARSAVT